MTWHHAVVCPASRIATVSTPSRLPIPGALRHCLCLMVVLCCAGHAHAQDAEEIDRKVDETLATFREKSGEGAEMMKSAAGVLVFPDVVRVGFGIGGEYGEGALLVDGLPVAYYSTSSSSFGLQLGAQAKSQVILFMTRDSLRRFRRTRGWEAGVDGSIAVVSAGAEGGLETETLQAPIVGFVFSSRGLMYNLSLEGNKINRLEP